MTSAFMALAMPSGASADMPSSTLAITTLAPPRAAPMRGGGLVAYELLIANRADAALILRSLTVRSSLTRRRLASFEGGDLQSRTIDFETGAAGLRVAPGHTALSYVETKAAIVPAKLSHDIVYEREGEQGEKSASLSVAVRPSAVVLAAPFRSGTWVAVHQPDWPRGHRRVLIGPPGDRKIPGRFAIDFVGVDQKGHLTSGDPDRPQDAVGYGEPVFAGADGLVAAVRDTVAESGSIAHNPARSEADAAGNYVALNIARSCYVFYEHLRPGSIHLKLGERVFLGQMIGMVGFSGNSTGPHLHLHVADGPDPARAEGLPFVLAHFEELGRYAQISGLGRERWSERMRQAHCEWPDYNAVIEFDERDFVSRNSGPATLACWVRGSLRLPTLVSPISRERASLPRAAFRRR